jgi:macrolide transport system ATP-binding/permease protein
MGTQAVCALQGIDLDIDAGEFVMVVGSSGSGKSTLMHLLGCLDRPTEGQYRIDGQDVSRLADAQLSRLRNRRVGFVFQQFNLLSNLNLLENIALPLVYSGLPRRARLETARRYAERLGLGDRLRHRPTELSGGQSQRVAIARALVNDPDLVFADEPTGNLDSATGEEIMRVLFDLNRQGYTIVMVTHDARYADQGTRRVTLADGRVVDDRPGRRVRSARRPPRDRREAWRGMSATDLARVGVREGLLAHKMRTALTMLGIVIGVAGVIAMSSFSLGSKKKQADQIRALGANLIRIVDNRLEGEKLSEARVRGSRGLNAEDMAMLRDLVPGIVRAAGARDAKLNIAGTPGAASHRILGVTDEYAQVNNLQLADGRFLDSHDQARCARVAVLGHGLRRLLGERSPVGESILMGGTPYAVVGVLADRQIDLKGLEATGATDSNYDLLIPLGTLLSRSRRLDMRSDLDEIQIQLRTEDGLYEAGTAVRRLLAIAHAGVEDFRLVIPLDLLKQKQQSQKVLDILTACVSSIALVVGGIGIMNIMLASVTERIREIGTRRAVGASRRDIQLQFLSESVIIAVTGGWVGMLVAMAAVAAVCTALRLPIVVSPAMVIVAVAASTATGLVFGLYPAAQAAARDPVESLRYE